MKPTVELLCECEYGKISTDFLVFTGPQPDDKKIDTVHFDSPLYSLDHPSNIFIQLAVTCPPMKDSKPIVYCWTRLDLFLNSDSDASKMLAEFLKRKLGNNESFDVWRLYRSVLNYECDEKYVRENFRTLTKDIYDQLIKQPHIARKALELVKECKQMMQEFKE